MTEHWSAEILAPSILGFALGSLSLKSSQKKQAEASALNFSKLSASIVMAWSDMTEKRIKRPTAANGKGIHDTLQLENVVWHYACPHIGARSLHHKSMRYGLQIRSAQRVLDGGARGRSSTSQPQHKHAARFQSCFAESQ
jgi:hypothetical protein